VTLVRPDGKISLPFLGDMDAMGLTPAELQRELTAKYGQVIRDARVTVIVTAVNSQRIYVIGEVRKEGPIQLIAPLTVLQALAEAGGLTEYAKRKDIYVLRTEQNKKVTLPFDYEAVVRGGKLSQDIVLVSGDTVVVPQ
jgi:polysaccharide export outer membrane protein